MPHAADENHQPRPPLRCCRPGRRDHGPPARRSVTPSSPEPTTRRTAAIVLAAGLGTRMRSSRPKVLHALCGRPMIDYVLDAWAAAEAEEPEGPAPATRPI